MTVRFYIRLPYTLCHLHSLLAHHPSLTTTRLVYLIPPPLPFINQSTSRRSIPLGAPVSHLTGTLNTYPSGSSERLTTTAIPATMCHQAVNSFCCGHTTIQMVTACGYAQASGKYCPDFQMSVDEAGSRYYDMPCMPCTGGGSGGKTGKSSSKKGKSRMK